MQCLVMDAAPICLSQNFVNKQNARSLGNIMKIETLKSDDYQIYRMDDSLLKEITQDLFSALKEIKTNLRIKSRQDFKEYFEMCDVNPSLHPVGKQVILKSSLLALFSILPRKLFGDNNQNVHIMRRIVECAVFSMRRQNVSIAKFIENWNFSSPLWNIPDNAAKKLLCFLIIWIMRNIFSQIICLNFYVTTCKIDADEYKLYYYRKNQWQSFYDKKVSEMSYSKVLKKCEMVSLGKNIKRNHSLGERLKLKSLKKDVPKLHLILKADNNYRPIVQYKSNSQSTAEKYKIKDRLSFLKMLLGKPQNKIETLYPELYKEWVKLDKPKLYFIKTDLSNAFGAVDIERLLKIFCEKHIALQKTEKNVHLKKKYAQQYKDMLAELKRPLLVRAGSTIYEWKKGLVQGYKYSPALSELYYKSMDEVYFSEHFSSSTAKIKLFTRVVDDYLYITDSLGDAHSFLRAVMNYNNVNYSKTEVNFEYPDIKCSKEISFFGHSYNTENLQVSRATNTYVGQMCYKIAFTGDITDVNKFLESRIGQSGIPINSHIFNLWYNPEQLIWRHIFTTYCLSANKFCTSLAILCEQKDMSNYLALFKKKVVVKLSNFIVDTLLNNKPVDCRFVFCINHFRHISWKALYLCAKGTPKCSVLIPQINIELAKSNCLFGKWREHASVINTTGEAIQIASKEVCQRSDLRIIIKEYDKLPSGFECYNHRNITR